MDRDQVLFRLFGKYCPEGTILFAEGAPGDAAFVIQSGAVRLGRTRHGGPAGEDLGPGELLGEECFLAGAPRRRRAETVRDSRLLRVNERTVDAFVRQSPESARNLLERFMAQRMGARTTELSSSHVPFVSHTQKVVEVIEEAAKSISNP